MTQVINEESLHIINEILRPFRDKYEAYRLQKENDRRGIHTYVRYDKPKQLELRVSPMPTDMYRENIEYSDVPLLLRLVQNNPYMRVHLVDNGMGHGVIYIGGVN